MKDKQKTELNALASIVDFATKQSIVNKEDIKEAEHRLDKIVADMNLSRKFFKRLL